MKPVDSKAWSATSFTISIAVAGALLILSSVALPQSNTPSRYWVFFKDKGRQSVVSAPQSLGITARALWRRSKVIPPGQLIDELDLPVLQENIDQVRATGAQIHAVSRWLNAVSAEVIPGQVSLVSALPCVRETRPVVVRVTPFPKASSEIPRYSLSKSISTTGLDYGPSLTQLSNIKVVDVHNIGINGTGVIVGMLDDGFNYHTVHPALKNIRVIAEYDFVQGDSNTSRRPGEFGGQGYHGAGTLSSIAGFDSGNLIGAAFGVSVILAKTEIDSVEIHQEEDNYVAGLEWMERLGADVASSSLGYRDFDMTTYSYTYQDLNGRTAICSMAAAVAARKGVLLCTAMGNDGIQVGDSTGKIVSVTRTLVAPADADSILGVGATFSDGRLASFSGTGPTSDGRIKPDIVAQGTAVYWADGNRTSGYWYVQGTSCSTPLVAGVAALVFSAHPELTPMQVRQAILSTATAIDDGTSMTASYPNNFYGYGFANALDAVLRYGPVFSYQPAVVTSDTQLVVTTSIVSKSGLVPDSVSLYFRRGSLGPFQRIGMNPTGRPNEYQTRIPRGSTSSPVVGYFSAVENSGLKHLSPYNAPDSLFVFNAVFPASFVLHQNYPNPFNSSTTLSFGVPQGFDTSNVRLVIYNILGQRVRTLVDGSVFPGEVSRRWDGKDDYGRIVATGLYLYRLMGSNFAATRKMLYIK